MDRQPGIWYRAVRYFLAVAFLAYGGVKLADIQFNRTYQPDLFHPGPADGLSGMELVWRFFGHSRGYQCLVGLLEVGAAVLLLSNRTAPLGAVVFLPIVANVVAVDLYFRVQADATVVALMLMAGDLLLLYADRSQVWRAADSLVRHRPDEATWRHALLGWGLAAVLLLLVYAAATAILKALGPVL